MTTVQDSVYVLEGSEESRSTISPQFVLVLVEKAAQKCNDFSSSFVKLVNGGDPKDAVTTSAALAQSIAQLLRNGTCESLLSYYQSILIFGNSCCC